MAELFPSIFPPHRRPHPLKRLLMDWTDHSSSLSLELTVGGRRRSPDESPAANGDIEAKLNQISEESKRIAEMVTSVLMNYTSLGGGGSPTKRKRAELENLVCSTAPVEEACGKIFRAGDPISTPISKIYVRTDPADSSLVVRDGHQWRKYGQKVTRDNPFPRAYFRCSFAPSCPVKKKVQRSAEDRTLLVATYDGEHNHRQPEQAAAAAPALYSEVVELSPSPSPSAVVNVVESSTSPSSIDLNAAWSMVDSEGSDAAVALVVERILTGVKSPRFRGLLVEEIATSFIKDSNFTAAIAAAVSEKILRCPRT